ncbi:ATP-binding cassette domain-containing protein, partial [Catenulispora yoronensis]|uniref:ATP-binding cassette domain-containing protein n=1 Tax=Catenulispora yoronensis TaxID=450799 RepID=UPI003CD09283
MNAVTEQRKVLLEIADLKVHFDIKDGKQWFWQPSKTLKAVDGVTLRLYEGETLGVVGESGCGKSTLLRMIAGLETITSGDLFIGDTRMNEIPPAERGVGMVFQSYALYPHLSVAENMSFGLKLAGAKKDLINQRVTQVAEVLQLAHLLERKPKALSGGQR